MIGKTTTLKIPTFDGTGPWELYHKQFEAAAAYNEWNDREKTVTLTVHLKGAAQRVLHQTKIVDRRRQLILSHIEDRDSES